MSLFPKTRQADQTDALRRVEEATEAHARTRHELDAAIAVALDVGVQPEALHDVGQIEPGHGKHAGDEAIGAPAMFDAFVQGTI
ncbi:hypothetical protein [Streptacidiphilus sp. P02-A3a]|uniref:hypothetical protein n=1 Tax=Streptacidiphilus sp. P02-A3a TaxID=2704468 RepID=UPI0015F88896|nr:hypothetical protein [Streptacidiphilus sp. P02-A3a]QMU70256.1 hypothetical protein GXP74_20585 [Streptacidiphilus sp. P02-A3a]QMU70286.1 hypothetical protein GXP74_20785 [Streptacidiphilus sp. P02-A3a]